jgi:hypothetical protein
MVIRETDKVRLVSDTTPHWAQAVNTDEPYGMWSVSWLVGHRVTPNQAMTAMVLAETVASGRPPEGDKLWPHIENWAGELELSATEAIKLIEGDFS